MRKRHFELVPDLDLTSGLASRGIHFEAAGLGDDMVDTFIPISTTVRALVRESRRIGVVLRWLKGIMLKWVKSLSRVGPSREVTQAAQPARSDETSKVVLCCMHMLLPTTSYPSTS